MDVFIPFIVGASIVVGAVVITPVAKTALDMAPYLYANTRCSARSAMLLQKKQYDDLIAASYVDEAFGLLENTSYRFLTEHAKDFTAFSKLCEEDLYKTYLWLAQVVPRDIIPLVMALALKFEVHDIKACVNSIKAGTALEDLKHVTDVNLRLKLESAKDMASFFSALEGSAYGELFSAHEPAAIVNSKLDQFYYHHVLDTIAQVNDAKAADAFRHYWRIMIDIANIKLALRRSSGSAAGDFIEGGFIPVKDLGAVTEHAQLETILANTAYKPFLTDTIEDGLFAYLRKQASTIHAQHTLKAGMIVMYIIMKELEIRNLNIIVKLKTENFKAEEISKVVVV